MFTLDRISIIFGSSIPFYPWYNNSLICWQLSSSTGAVGIKGTSVVVTECVDVARHIGYEKKASFLKGSWRPTRNVSWNKNVTFMVSMVLKGKSDKG